MSIRPLPARFNLEYEKKQAKKRLALLRETNPEAQLADAHFTIAREYGFASWPKLVRYFEDAERQAFQLGTPASYGMEHFESGAQSLLRGHARRDPLYARFFAAYVPRFYGAAFDEIFAATVSIEEARLAQARSRGFPSWEVLTEEAAAIKGRMERRERSPRVDPNGVAWALRSGRLEQILTLYPDQISDLLCGGMQMRPETVQTLLARGADPNHVMPTGIPVLEYALIRYWNGRAVDVLAARAKPRRALWIAAGLGDHAGVAGFLDRDGRPTREAHAVRPDYVAVGFPPMGPPLPEASDEEILMEAFVIACSNARTSVIEYLSSRGFDVDCLLYGGPLLGMAAGNGWADVVECLLKCGANPDLVSSDPNGTARDYARYMIEQLPDDPVRQRIADLLGVPRKS